MGCGIIWCVSGDDWVVGWVRCGGKLLGMSVLWVRLVVLERRGWIVGDVRGR